MAGKTVRARTLWTLVVSAATAACGGAPAAGPSPIVAPPAGTVTTTTSAPAPTPRPVPAWIDPALRGTLLTFDAAGWPQRWDGGPFHHCFSVAADELATAQAVAQRMSDLTGIPRTEVGACNVEWQSDATVGHTSTEMHGNARAVLSAKVWLRSSNSEAIMLHEAGHVLGLGHSPNPRHLMNATPRAADFTPEELAVLAWLYAR